MAAVHHLGSFIFPQFWGKILSCVYFYVVVQNLVKMGQCAAELLRIFDFQNDGVPLEIGIGARGQKTRMIILPDRRKKFKDMFSRYRNHTRLGLRVL